MRVAKPIQLSSDDDRHLRILSKRKRVDARVQVRSHIVLLAAAGMTDKDIAQKLDVGRPKLPKLRGHETSGADLAL